MKIEGLIVVALLLPGCVTQAPISHVEALDRQNKTERIIRTCRNVGGIWYHTGRGRSGGYCDWTPLL